MNNIIPAVAIAIGIMVAYLCTKKLYKSFFKSILYGFVAFFISGLAMTSINKEGFLMILPIVLGGYIGYYFYKRKSKSLSKSILYGAGIWIVSMVVCMGIFGNSGNDSEVQKYLAENVYDEPWSPDEIVIDETDNIEAYDPLLDENNKTFTIWAKTKYGKKVLITIAVR